MAKLKDRSVGVIVYHLFPRSIKFLVLKHRKGHWSFAKGHKEAGESPMQTAVRELFEEAGMKDVEFLARKILLKEKYIYVNKRKQNVEKSVSYFIAMSKNGKVRIDNKEITGFKWCTMNAAEKILTYEQSTTVLKKAVKLISKKERIESN